MPCFGKSPKTMKFVSPHSSDGVDGDTRLTAHIMTRVSSVPDTDYVGDTLHI